MFGSFGIFCLFDLVHGLFGCEVLLVCFFSFGVCLFC